MLYPAELVAAGDFCQAQKGALLDKIHTLLLFSSRSAAGTICEGGHKILMTL